MTMSPSSTQVPPITEDDIAEFLAQTPGFFERHAEVLASVQITSPHGQRAVSLQERQAEMLREKIKGLEQRIMEMVRNSNENAAIAQKIHRWTRELAEARNPSSLPFVVEEGIRRLFDVPQAALRLWDVAPTYAGADYAQGASADARAFASSLTMPFCGPNLGFEPTAWLPDAGQVQSLALLPLREGAIDSPSPAFGLLVLGSPDPLRFDASMGTDFLARMAELASGALSRLR
ncbi:hypothetical protein SAMN05192589_103456 [Paracidovorax valerianellae]|uniref:DUF484 domain-containing protein n=2 Tax=Paracidovorax valerianellae TaxID=187868 RepID=A0A1G6Q9J0_9BURK|nr:hypothetical protein SAMN05192589_103456 [Paracidovorax valerianellae]